MLPNVFLLDIQTSSWFTFLIFHHRLRSFYRIWAKYCKQINYRTNERTMNASSIRLYFFSSLLSMHFNFQTRSNRSNWIIGRKWRLFEVSCWYIYQKKENKSRQSYPNEFLIAPMKCLWIPLKFRFVKLVVVRLIHQNFQFFDWLYRGKEHV